VLFLLWRKKTNWQSKMVQCREGIWVHNWCRW